jgi:hypothetical protein
LGLLVRVYVPSRTMTVSPGLTRSAAFWMVLKGAACVPGLASEPDGDT